MASDPPCSESRWCIYNDGTGVVIELRSTLNTSARFLKRAEYLTRQLIPVASLGISLATWGSLSCASTAILSFFCPALTPFIRGGILPGG